MLLRTRNKPDDAARQVARGHREEQIGAVARRRRVLCRPPLQPSGVRAVLLGPRPRRPVVPGVAPLPRPRKRRLGRINNGPRRHVRRADPDRRPPRPSERPRDRRAPGRRRRRFRGFRLSWRRLLEAPDRPRQLFEDRRRRARPARRASSARRQGAAGHGAEPAARPRDGRDVRTRFQQVIDQFSSQSKRPWSLRVFRIRSLYRSRKIQTEHDEKRAVRV